MIGIFDYLTLRRVFTIPISSEEVNERLRAAIVSSRAGGFYCKRIENNLFKVSARISLGTLVFSGGGGTSISAYVDLSELNVNRVIVFTRVRVEHYFFSVVFLIIGLATYFDSDGGLYDVLFPIGLFVVFHFWFHFVYRVQENHLIFKVAEFLDLNRYK